MGIGMAKNIDDAFDTLIGWLKPTESESAAAKSHRESISTRLVNDFSMTSMPRTGSFGHGTSISGYSDIDYFAVIPSDKLYKSSAYALQKVKDSLKIRFPNTDIVIRSPAIVVPFGADANETHEITPAYANGSSNGYNIYGIPDRNDGWMNASPLAHNAWVNAINDKHTKKVKQLIRLVKYWNIMNGGGIRSFYLELRSAEFANSESSILYRYDVKSVFGSLVAKNLAGMQDPQGISGLVQPCSEAVKPSALSKLNTALTRANNALEAEKAGRISEAFGYWDKVFNGKFPAYS
jgi:Second Messenger Oligonucleotide or Dinucleotide Synthetase domain